MTRNVLGFPPRPPSNARSASDRSGQGSYAQHTKLEAAAQCCNDVVAKNGLPLTAVTGLSGITPPKFEAPDML